ncbi:Ig-like domain-containing protein [Nocardioides oleivorans]|nr:Ig-like domain-containing protein [Nocardioides oleivorans]
MTSRISVGARARRGLRTLTVLALPATTLALVGLGAPAAQAANPDADCVLSGNTFACTLTYAYTGSAQTLRVPNAVDKVSVVAVGGQGATYDSSSTPGRGAVVSADVPVTPGATYYVMVGGNAGRPGGGWNGGGNAASSAGGGGGATDLRSVPSSDPSSLSSRVIVAGGGGGGDLRQSNGGDAGLDGANGRQGDGAVGSPGAGGTQTAGGAGGASPVGNPGTNGQLGLGGNGGAQWGGGGGGGLYGGGGAGGGSTTGSGGGGGSSLVPAGGTVVVNSTGQAPQLRVTYTSYLAGSDLSLGAPSVAAGVANPVTMTVTDGSATKTVTPQTLTIAPTGGATGATCTATACSATQIGTYTVTGTYGTQTQKATFKVVAGDAASIDLTPATGTAAAGEQVDYTVTGTDTYGNVLGDLTADSLVTWTGPGGTNVACPSGVCTIDVVGAYTINASTPGAGGAAVTDSATLTVTAADVATLKLSPANAVVAAGQSRSYTVTGKDAFGNDLGDLTSSAAFSFAPYDGGASTACVAATCTPATAGVYQVTATVGGVSATATLVVEAVATEVTVTPVSGIVFGADVPVSATVSSGAGTPTGTVQFSLDGTAIGAPVTVGSNGVAALPDVTGLHAGLHTIGAAYTSADGSFARGDDESSFVVAKAPTTTAVTTTPGKLTATVTGAGEPTGDVTFFVDGVDVGSAALVDGTATLEGTSNDGGSVVGASYAGDADHEASSTSTSRTAPVVTPKADGPGRNDWYNGPVTVSFTCGSDVTTCPAPVVLDKEGAGQYVTRTVIGTDGGVTTVTAGPYNLDLTAPAASVSRVGNGKTYKGRARIGECVGGDALSGLASCTVATTGGPFGAMTTTVTTADVAGNTTTSTASYQVLGTWLARSKQVGSAWTLGKGSRRVLHVMSTKAPRLSGSDAVTASTFRMVGRTGGITEWVASLTASSSLKAGRTVSLKLTSSQGAQTVRLSIIR